MDNLLEKLDNIEGILFLQSLAGGTGSGLGSFLLEDFNDRYKTMCLNICVVPHLSGEVILQSYNCALSLSHLYKHTDGIILLNNDYANSIC